MSDTIITVENLGKRYQLGAGRSNERYTALRDVISDKARSIFGNPRSATRNGSEANASDFWALKDVSFEVRRGEVLGIIGRNGAGKSTLLKILSRITEPTGGRIRIKGRVASLLEVGTGFHPELTGRENIFLNGAILGMHRHEIKAKFDEIVAFAEVERFLDTPVKRYSSGMYVRLAFAVAAHLEPEILIVDEVLAVGDAEFQRKCLGKMHQVAGEQGRTVLFVSHNMDAVAQLCSRALVISAGSIVIDSDATSATREYLKTQRHRRAYNDPIRLNEQIELDRISFDPSSVLVGEEQAIKLEFVTHKATTLTELAILIYSEGGIRVAIVDCRGSLPVRLKAGEAAIFTTRIARMPLIPAQYPVGLYLATTESSADFLDICRLIVEPSGSRERSGYPTQYLGYVELFAEIAMGAK